MVWSRCFFHGPARVTGMVLLMVQASAGPAAGQSGDACVPRTTVAALHEQLTRTENDARLCTGQRDAALRQAAEREEKLNQVLKTIDIISRERDEAILRAEARQQAESAPPAESVQELQARLVILMDEARALARQREATQQQADHLRSELARCTAGGSVGRDMVDGLCTNSGYVPRARETELVARLASAEAELTAARRRTPDEAASLTAMVDRAERAERELDGMRRERDAVRQQLEQTITRYTAEIDQLRRPAVSSSPTGVRPSAAVVSPLPEPEAAPRPEPALSAPPRAAPIPSAAPVLPVGAPMNCALEGMPGSFIGVAAGTYRAGGSRIEKWLARNGVTEIIIDKPFCVGIEEVKRRDFEEYFRAQPSNVQRDIGDQWRGNSVLGAPPESAVARLPHAAARAYANWLKSRTRREIALPSANQWFAAAILQAEMDQSDASFRRFSRSFMNEVAEWSSESCTSGAQRKFYLMGYDRNTPDGGLEKSCVLESLQRADAGFRLVYMP